MSCFPHSFLVTRGGYGGVRRGRLTPQSYLFFLSVKHAEPCLTYRSVTLRLRTQPAGWLGDVESAHSQRAGWVTVAGVWGLLAPLFLSPIPRQAVGDPVCKKSICIELPAAELRVTCSSHPVHLSDPTASCGRPNIRSSYHRSAPFPPFPPYPLPCQDSQTRRSPSRRYTKPHSHSMWAVRPWAFAGEIDPGSMSSRRAHLHT